MLATADHRSALVSDPGNLSQLAQASTEAPHGADPGFAAQSFGEVVGRPPPFGLPRLSIKAWRIDPGGTLGSTLVSAIPVVLLAALLIHAAWTRRWRRAAAPSTMLVAIAAALWAAARAPVTGEVFVGVYQTRWLWPLAAVVWLTIARGTARVWTAPERVVVPRPVTVAIAAGLVVAGLVVPVFRNLITDRSVLPELRPRMEAVAEVDDQLGPELGAGPYLVRLDGGEDVRFNVGPTLVDLLELHGVSTYVTSQEDVPWELIGSHRRWEGSPVRGVLTVVTGDAAAPAVPGTRLVVRTPALTVGERAELDRLRVHVRADVRRRRSAGGTGDPASVDAQVQILDSLMAANTLEAAYFYDQLPLPSPGDDVLEKLTSLQRRDDPALQVRVYLSPATGTEER